MKQAHLLPNTKFLPWQRIPRTIALGAAFMVCTPSLATEKPNILFILADDIGAQQLAFSQSPSDKTEVASTPTLDKLAKQGVIYDQAWASPLSSPTRACLLTGQYGSRTGMTSLMRSLDPKVSTVADLLRDKAGYRTSIIGKWHVSRPPVLPKDYGFDHFAGIVGGGARSYEMYRFFQNGGTASRRSDYITTRLTDEAIAWIKQQSSGAHPWFCWLSYTAAHTPLHLPPNHLHHQKNLSGEQSDIESNPHPYYRAMIEAMDTEIGRLLASMPKEVRDRTVIIFMGDNGAAANVQIPAQQRGRAKAKGSVYRGGIHVPLFATGAGVTRQGQRDSRLIAATDFYTTFAEIAGQKLPRYKDSYSFASSLDSKDKENIRPYLYSEIEHQRRGYVDALSDGEYKLISFEGGASEFYHIASDRDEKKPLSDAERKDHPTYQKLVLARAQLKKSFPDPSTFPNQTMTHPRGKRAKGSSQQRRGAHRAMTGSPEQ